ncbi:MAG: hypothetical protein AAGH46_09710, partial [Bacteroidota bacterium]
MYKILLSLSMVLILSGYSQDKIDYKIETSDIVNFWIAFDSVKKVDNKSEVFTKLYLENASDLFDTILNVSGDLRDSKNYLESFEKYPKFWESLRKPTLELRNIASDINSCFEKVRSVYPKFKPGDICVFIGPWVIEGSVINGKIFMGAEMNVSLNDIDISEFEEDISFAYLNDIKSTIIHETIHLQQKGKPKNLLQIAIREGSADFLAELFLGAPFISPMYDYGRENESELWKEFSEEIDSENWSKWISSMSRTEERPADLGYFMGYMITKSYYNKAKNKELAIQKIIE